MSKLRPRRTLGVEYHVYARFACNSSGVRIAIRRTLPAARRVEATLHRTKLAEDVTIITRARRS